MALFSGLKLRCYISLGIFWAALIYIGGSLVDLFPLSDTGKIILGAVAVVALYVWAGARRRLNRR